MVWKYGRKVIDALFKRWAKRTPVCARLATQREADCDRSHIRVFEAGLSSQRSGNHQQSTRDTQEEVGKELIAVAKQQGLYISKNEWVAFGERKRVPSGESIVFFDNQQGQVIKVRDPFAKVAIKQIHPEDVIYEHLVHNLLFPDTRYQFIGISEDVDGVRIVLSQSYISKQFLLPDKNLIDKYLTEGLGLRKEKGYFYGNDYLAVTDVAPTGDNVLFDGKKLYFIDPIICLKKPAKEILNHYYTLLR